MAKTNLTRLVTYVDEASAKRIQHAAVDARLTVSTFLGFAALELAGRVERKKAETAAQSCHSRTEGER